ncbi:cytochrome c [Rhodobacteraceae bacterium LMO-12]|nr:cytochrome c [Rhodobacteraceae bacterium LMO-JJ12]
MVRMLLAMLLAGAVQAEEPREHAVDPVALERLVLQDCGSCHGLTLKGGLGPDIRPESLEFYEPEVLMGVILDGIPGTAMPPWRPLITEDEAAWIADYLLQVETK